MVAWFKIPIQVFDFKAQASVQVNKFMPGKSEGFRLYRWSSWRRKYDNNQFSLDPSD